MNSQFRFLHTADLHLDSPLKSLARRDTALAEHVANATRSAFENIVDLCIQEQVQALLLAGDIYDTQNPSVATVGFFLRQLNRLKDTNTHVYMIRGNHDHYSKLVNTVQLPNHVTEFHGKKKSETLKEHGVAIHGVSFKEEHATESALRDFKAPNEKFRNIALLHTSLGGSEGHDIYAPCSITELDSMGFDYWALGHIHKRQVAGDVSKIVMPGTPQGRDMGESGAKTVTLVTLNEHDCEIEERTVSPVQFERITVDLTDLDEHNGLQSDTLKRFTESFVKQVNSIKNESPHIERWIFRVTCQADAETLFTLKSDSEHTEDAIRLAAEPLFNVHLDKIHYRLLDGTSASSKTDHSLLTQLSDVVMEHLDDEQLTAMANEEFDALIKFLPTKSLRDELQGTTETRQNSIRTLQIEGIKELLSMIQIDRAKES